MVDLHLRWIARRWPITDDVPARQFWQGEEGNVLIARSVSGVIVRLDAYDGRLLGCEMSVAAAS